MFLFLRIAAWNLERQEREFCKEPTSVMKNFKQNR